MARMQVVLFRHGIAEDRVAFAATGAPDCQRPLTDKGARRTRLAAAGLLSVLPAVDVIGTSALTRARQTADAVAAACEDAGPPPERETVAALQPGGDPLDVCRWLAGQGQARTVVLVGHEPDLSGLMAWLTTGRPEGFARFKKAAACLIELPTPAPGGGELVWHLPPVVLRRLGQG